MSGSGPILSPSMKTSPPGNRMAGSPMTVNHPRSRLRATVPVEVVISRVMIRAGKSGTEMMNVWVPGGSATWPPLVFLPPPNGWPSISTEAGGSTWRRIVTGAGVGVASGTGVSVGARVGVEVRVGVGVGVAVGVGVGVGIHGGPSAPKTRF